MCNQLCLCDRLSPTSRFASAARHHREILGLHAAIFLEAAPTWCPLVKEIPNRDTPAPAVAATLSSVHFGNGLLVRYAAKFQCSHRQVLCPFRHDSQRENRLGSKRRTSVKWRSEPCGCPSGHTSGCGVDGQLSAGRFVCAGGRVDQYAAESDQTGVFPGVPRLAGGGPGGEVPNAPNASG